MKYFIESLAQRHLREYIEKLVCEIFQANFESLQDEIVNLRSDKDSDLGVIFSKIEKIASEEIRYQLKKELEELPYNPKPKKIGPIFQNIISCFAEEFVESFDYESFIFEFSDALLCDKRKELLRDGKINDEGDYIHLPAREF